MGKLPASWNSSARTSTIWSLIERHFKHTGSTRARVLLDDWAAARGKFVKVFPNEYKRALIEMAADAAMDVQAVAA